MATVALGAFVVQEEKMILHPLRKILDRLPGLLRKPLTACPRCMVSVWGTAAVILVHFVATPVNWWLLPVYWLSAVGLQEMLDR